jgi:hypothetical protein
MADARVRDTIATGYTYQGQKLRPALVSLQNPPPAGDNSDAPASKTSGSADTAAESLEEPTLL